ncbi:GNAT family N-acetyltransferase [Allosphingosinicella deserti]|uniref:N-acetyltransferase domain-containing protein n=1 Tax=Allosphingosinicella deserti TaxID=2116704 RepID=A0A2P7QI83_9SPHN|nr:hypothetical protein [Sphingomonas deserti]PSJ37684.1 hypothetical protein C7I55_21735 [Sphingomonas deserti]
MTTRSTQDTGAEQFGAFAISRYEGDAARCEQELLAACQRIFPGFDGGYLVPRLHTVTDPVLFVARVGLRLAAFKLAYRPRPTLLYSWLGGVDPESKRRGVAAHLMRKQHALTRHAGCAAIETRTRATITPMIMLNLRHGFEITGYGIDHQEAPAGRDATMRYAARLEEGKWIETGDLVAQGRTPERMFEMELTRIGDCNWPAAR